jgi:hypothetical protein
MVTSSASMVTGSALLLCLFILIRFYSYGDQGSLDGDQVSFDVDQVSLYGDWGSVHAGLGSPLWSSLVTWVATATCNFEGDR